MKLKRVCLAVLLRDRFNWPCRAQPWQHRIRRRRWRRRSSHRQQLARPQRLLTLSCTINATIRRARKGQTRSSSSQMRTLTYPSSHLRKMYRNMRQPTQSLFSQMYYIPTSASSTRLTDIHLATADATDYDLVPDLAIPCRPTRAPVAPFTTLFCGLGVTLVSFHESRTISTLKRWHLEAQQQRAVPKRRSGYLSRMVQTEEASSDGENGNQ